LSKEFGGATIAGAFVITEEPLKNPCPNASPLGHQRAVQVTPYGALRLSARLVARWERWQGHQESL
jgi:hypothetical protein